jgi:hypothetical protein
MFAGPLDDRIAQTLYLRGVFNGPASRLAQWIKWLNGARVRFGSKADVTVLNFDVRFTPESGHSLG